MGLNITDLPAHVQRQIAERERKPGAVAEAAAEKKPVKIRLLKRKMSQTEIEYGMILKSEFADCDVKYEPFTLRFESSNRYTPDWVIFRGSIIVRVCEVKGKYRLGSAGRSAAVFKEAIAEYPHWTFRHATKTDAGWSVTESEPTSFFCDSQNKP